MATENIETPVQELFLKYRETFDPDHTLEIPGETISIAEFWQYLERQHKIDADTVAERVASICQLPHMTGRFTPPDTLVRRIPRKIADKFLVVPVGVEDDEPVLALANPLNKELLENISFLFGTHYRLTVATPGNIELAIALGYENQGATNKKKQDDSFRNTENSAIPRLARQLMVKALAKNASDMHVQPFIGGSVVRIRVDGYLQRMVILPETVANSLIRYFKARGKMDPTLNLVPQDGRMLVELDDHEYDLRLSTLPVAGQQEKMVIRFLNRQSVYKLSAIGFSLDEIHALNRMASCPSGVVLVCGPTGSGKTTTLYSILNDLNNEDTSIMTVENPVEYTMAGLSQTEINDKAGMTFPRALRAILRQDPDVILIGEIRDEETAQIAMQSALTGHLVFSTLHTNDSLSAIPRLLDLGIKPIIMAEALSGIMSQRLVRKLCKSCRQPLGDNADPAAKAFAAATHADQAFREVGCEACDYTGFKGRTVIAELVEINHEQRQLLLGGESDIAVFKQAMQGTFNSMSMSASRLIIAGETTATEASNVIGQQFWMELVREYHGQMPDLSALTKSDGGTTKNVILITGNLDEASSRLGQVLEDGWFHVITADSPEKADGELRIHEETSLVVLEIGAHLTDEEVIHLVADYRAHVAWARIPALIRIPESRPELEPLLREHGATSRFVTSGTPLESILAIIQDALSHNLDFKWGLNDTHSADTEDNQADLEAENQLVTQVIDALERTPVE